MSRRADPGGSPRSWLDWDRVQNPKALFLFVNKEKTSYQIERVVVSPVKGRGAIRK
jgi:hypothetical protein